MIRNKKGKNFDDFYEFKKYKKKRKISRKDKIFKIIPLLFIPILISLTVISTYGGTLVKKPLNYIVYALLILFIIMLLVGLFTGKKKKTNGKKWGIIKIFLILYIVGNLSGLILLYGPDKRFKTWLISTAMSTMNHQYLCKWFYSKKDIDKIINSNYVIEVDEETDKDLIKIDAEDDTKYANEYEKQILKHKKDDKYKIIELTVNGQKAYLAAIYDPSLVKVAVTSRLSISGQYVTKMAADHKALLAVNGGGFYDPGYTDAGGKPTGVTLSGGKVITNNNYSNYTQSGGLIGITNDNVLVLMKNATGQKALAAGIRDGVSWGPFLIVNGKKSFIKGNGGWGYAARTAIGQRKDGIILLLVVDSNSSRTKGADMVDLTEIMDNYGAVNAANLDGGTSSVFVLPAKEALKYKEACGDTYCYINEPIDGRLRHRTRAIATSIIVAE